MAERLTNFIAYTLCIFACIFILLPSGLYLVGETVEHFTQPVPRCKIVGDREFNTGRCIPYCPPRPSDCG
jgi:hypothetical protein